MRCFLLCFERGQSDRCLLRNINCFLAGTCINSCHDLLLNIRQWHKKITWEDSQFDITRSGRQITHLHVCHRWALSRATVSLWALATIRVTIMQRSRALGFFPQIFGSTSAPKILLSTDLLDALFCLQQFLQLAMPPHVSLTQGGRPTHHWHVLASGCGGICSWTAFVSTTHDLLFLRNTPAHLFCTSSFRQSKGTCCCLFTFGNVLKVIHN